MFRSINRLSINLSKVTLNRPLRRSLKEWTGRYLPNHEWIYPDSVNSTSYKMGLAKSGLEEFTELVYIDFPSERGDKIEEGDDLVIMESVKASDSIAAPYDCVLVNINEDYNLEAINADPECLEHSWLVEIKPIGDDPKFPTP